MNRDATAQEVLSVPTGHDLATRPSVPLRLRTAVNQERNDPTLRFDWPGKRVLDVLGALILLIAFSPIILGVVGWLSLCGGPIIFRHERIGRGGQPFTCYKFVTMVRDADRVLMDLLRGRPDLHAEWTKDQKLRDDPRVTRLGRFLRRTSLDELPQLWNVLKGEMSLVGPRPIVRQEIERYRGAIRHYLGLRPGLTGLWQVSGRNDIAYRRRVVMDRAYAQRASLVFDLWILLRTVNVVLFQRGAY